jgi:hypothetical protein
MRIWSRRFGVVVFELMNRETFDAVQVEFVERDGR